MKFTDFFKKIYFYDPYDQSRIRLLDRGVALRSFIRFKITELDELLNESLKNYL